MKKRTCRMCGGRNFKRVIDFGKNPLVNSLVEKEDLDKKEPVYQLTVVQCQDCFLVQTENPIDSHKIYTDTDYLYYSSDMPGLAEYFKEYAVDIKQRFLDEEDFVVEIGSNDGILLQLFQGWSQPVLGIDPATNVVVRALANGIPTLSAPFNKRFAKHIARDWGRAKVICGNNCIAHIDDLDGVMEGVTELLSDDGVFVVECNYWGGMVKNKNYALIYHDHFSYFTLQAWFSYLKKFNMEPFDAWVTPAQGGSLRMFACKTGEHERTERYAKLLQEEEDTGLNSYKTAQKYYKDVTFEAKKLHGIISDLKKQGKRIAGYGAAAKGFSVLKLAGITEKHLDYFVDDSPAKQGKWTPVTHIPIISRKETEGFESVDYFFITAPNYEKVIVEKEAEFLSRGGCFITIDGRIIKK